MNIVPHKILVVDDDQKIVELVKLYLERVWFRVFTAIDGLQALEMARQKQPDLIILDVMLPKIDGLDVLRLLICRICDTHHHAYGPAHGR